VIVDAHHHLWDLAVRPQDWLAPDRLAPIRRTFSVDDLAAVTGAAGVSATVVVQAIPVAAETPELLAVAATSELIVGVVGWVDLTDAAAGDQIAELRAGPGGDRLVSIRHPVQSEADPGWLARADVRRGLRAVADAGLAYDLLVTAVQLPAAVAVVRDLPELRFVLDHLAKPLIAAGELEPWAHDLRELAAADNVAAKISGLITEADWAQWTVADLAPYVQVALAAFGPERLMFGSDWPVSLLAGEYGRWLDTARELVAELSPVEQDRFFAGSAREWYRLP